MSGRTILAAALLSVISTSAVFSQEDSCTAGIRWDQDAADPMMFYFSFNGTVPPGSFAYNCVWDFGDGNTSTDSFTTHIYLQPGSYTVCIDFTICIGGGLSCHDDTCITITAGALSQVEGVKGLSGFYVYPNPVRSDLHLRMNPGAETVRVSLLTTTGKELQSELISADAWKFDVSDLPPGLYLVRVSDSQKSITRKLVIKD